jgi:hypothetical protein
MKGQHYTFYMHGHASTVQLMRRSKLTSRSPAEIERFQQKGEGNMWLLLELQRPTSMVRFISQLCRWTPVLIRKDSIQPRIKQLPNMIRSEHSKLFRGMNKYCRHCQTFAIQKSYPLITIHQYGYSTGCEYVSWESVGFEAITMVTMKTRAL